MDCSRVILLSFVMSEGRVMEGKLANSSAKKLSSLEKQERLQRLCEKTGYQIIQKNGQRIFQLPGTESITPEKGSEVFVARLSKDVLEDDIVSLFGSIGPIFNVRLMLDFHDNPRGYCFVSYYYKKHAFEAVIKFNNATIGKGKSRIIVNKSLDNRRLFLGHIPLDKTKEDIQDLLDNFVEGVVDIILYPSRERKGQNRGYAFIEFTSHEQAAMARRLLSPGSLTAWGIPMVADWADPVPDICPQILTQLKNLFVRNIDMSMTHQQVLELIHKYVPAEQIMRLYTKYDYAFIHFGSRMYAEKALKILQGKRFGANKVEVEWARPPIYSRANRISRPPSNFCTSVPPIIRRQVTAMKEAKLRNKTSPRNSENLALPTTCGQFDCWNHKGVRFFKNML